jgi:hypothetical protein
VEGLWPDSRATPGLVAAAVLSLAMIGSAAQAEAQATTWAQASGRTQGADETQAQAAPPESGSFDVGVGLGAFVDYPPQFSDAGCEGGVVGISTTGAWRALSFLAVEGSLSAATGAGGQTCAIADAIAIPPDTPYTDRRYAEGIEGSGFFATHLSVIAEPFAASPVSPRARLGVGRLWNKSLNNWLWGVGVRYRFGRHSLVMDVEGWNMEIDAEVQTLIYRSATSTTEILATEIVPETVRPYQVRVGWEVVIG